MYLCIAGCLLGVLSCLLLSHDRDREVGGFSRTCAAGLARLTREEGVKIRSTEPKSL